MPRCKRRYVIPKQKRDAMKTQIATKNAPAAIGPYSQAIKAGDTVYVSGQLGIDPSTGNLPEGLEAQARQSLTNIKNILAEAGYELGDVVKTTCLLADIADFGKFNEIYSEFFCTDLPSPARSAFAVKALPKGALVEVEAIAAK